MNFAPRPRTAAGTIARMAGRAALAGVIGVGAGHAWCQRLHYVEPGVAACLAPAAPAAAAPKVVPRGVAVAGSLHVSCGFEQGSYTVSLGSTDPEATFVPSSFLVNFGRIAGNGAFAVTFSTVGVQTISTRISANMGSPAVAGRFVSVDPGFKVVEP